MWHQALNSYISPLLSILISSVIYLGFPAFASSLKIIEWPIPHNITSIAMIGNDVLYIDINGSQQYLNTNSGMFITLNCVVFSIKNDYQRVTWKHHGTGQYTAVQFNECLKTALITCWWRSDLYISEFFKFSSVSWLSSLYCDNVKTITTDFQIIYGLQ